MSDFLFYSYACLPVYNPQVCIICAVKIIVFLLDDLVEFLWGVCDVQLDNRAKTDTMRTWLYAKNFNDNNNGSNNNNIEYIYNYII